MLPRAILLMCVFCLPCLAGDGTTPVIIFRNHAARSTEIVWTKSSNISPPDDVYDFVPIDGDMLVGDYLNNYPSTGYSLSP